MVRAPRADMTGLMKGSWSREEDQILTDYIHKFGHTNWEILPQRAGLLRCGKSCRLRWMNYLRPGIKRGEFTHEELVTIVNLHRSIGNRWSTIAESLPGRTDNDIKNIWHSRLKKRLHLFYTPTDQEPTGPTFNSAANNNNGGGLRTTDFLANFSPSPPPPSPPPTHVPASSTATAAADTNFGMYSDDFPPVYWVPSWGTVWGQADSAAFNPMENEARGFWTDLLKKAEENELPDYVSQDRIKIN